MHLPRAACCRRRRRQVHAWTANTAGMMRAVLDAGVEAVVTNHPRKLQEAVDSRLLRCRQQRQEQQQGQEQQGQEQPGQEQQQGREQQGQQPRQAQGVEAGRQQERDPGWLPVAFAASLPFLYAVGAGSAHIFAKPHAHTCYTRAQQE